MKLRNALLSASAAIVLGAGSLSAADSMHANMMWVKESVTAPSNATVKVSATMGDVIIRTWNFDKVVVRSEAVHGTFTVDATSDNDMVRIDARSFGPAEAATQAVHVIYVPAQATVIIGEIAGGLTINDPKQTLTIEHATASAQFPESMLPPTM